MAVESRHKPLAVEGALVKLRDSSVVIHRREGLKNDEEKRVADAMTLLKRGAPETGSKGEKGRTKYHKFLQKVDALAGKPMVVLCAAGLGSSAVSNMRDRVRLDLPYEIEEIKEELVNSTLQKLANAYSGVTPRALVTYPNNALTPIHADASPDQLQSAVHQNKKDTLDTTSTAASQHSPVHVLTSKHPQSVSLNFQLRDLVEFLQQYQESDHRLQMECPFFGNPLPFIRFGFGQSAELGATLEFSQPLATLFIQYVMNRG